MLKLLRRLFDLPITDSPLEITVIAWVYENFPKITSQKDQKFSDLNLTIRSVEQDGSFVYALVDTSINGRIYQWELKLSCMQSVNGDVVLDITKPAALTRWYKNKLLTHIFVGRDKHNRLYFSTASTYPAGSTASVYSR